MFGLDVPQLIRFLYTGFLLVGLLQLSPVASDLNARLNSLGTAVSVLLVLSIGMVIWTVYHQVIGEFFWFQFIHTIHKKLPGVSKTSDMALLEECGVPFLKRRMAYQMFRASYLSAEDRRWVDLNHAYNQLLDVTWIEIGFVLGYWRSDVSGFAFLSFAGVACLLIGIATDIRQHAMERFLMMKNGQAAFRDWLEMAGMLRR